MAFQVADEGKVVEDLSFLGYLEENFVELNWKFLISQISLLKGAEANLYTFRELLGSEGIHICFHML